MELYQLQALTFSYPGQDQPALSSIHLDIHPGEWLTLLGASGCGKTTLLRQLKPALTPHGNRRGHILFQGQPLEQLSPAQQASQIGFVLQSPEDQIVTDKVWHELAFGLESLGLPREVIRARVAEMASFFGLEDWFDRDTASLSGGQKQLLNLAAIMAMDPQVLLLDEPTSQLDPIAAQTFLDCLSRINRELGTTIVLSEHRLEQALPLSHRCLFLEDGQLRFLGSPQELGRFLRQQEHPMVQAMPTPMRVWMSVGEQGDCPVTVSEGRQWLGSFAQRHPLSPLPLVSSPPPAPAALEARELWFRYQKEGEDVLKGLSVSIPRGSRFAILGGNGAGKSTLLSLLGGGNRPLRGSVSLLGRPLSQWGKEELYQGGLAVLPQNPKALFSARSVEEELSLAAPPPDRLKEVITLCHLEGLLGRHPYDLSGGEQQRAALAKVLLAQPQVLLLDEPTKGMDLPFQEEFAALLEALSARGITVVLVSHDIEFCASHATHCALLFGGILTAQGEPHSFFSQNRFYTTAASRMARDLIPQAITSQELIGCCCGREPQLTPFSYVQPSVSRHPEREPAASSTSSPPRWLGLLLIGLCLAAGLLAWQGVPWLAGLAGGSWLSSLLWLLTAAGGLWLLGLGRLPLQRLPRSPGRPRRSTLLLTGVCLLVLIPLTLLAGVYLLQDRKYYFISLLVLLEALAPVFLSLEGSRPQARMLVLLSALAALAAAGRAAFFMLPQFKPGAAIAIVAGVAFGGQAGFLVGALSMLLSNFFYVQGAWTPWQMAAMGLVGLLAGWLSRWVGRSRFSLALYGFLSVILLYGGLLNPASLLMFQPHPTLSMIVASWTLGFPMDLVHGAGTAFFLWAGGPPLLEQLERMRTKYGL